MRGHNEGSISTFSNGRVRVRVTMRDGTVRTKSVSGSDQRDVEKRARAELRKMLSDRDANLRGSDSSLGSFLTSWSADMAGTVAPATWERYDEHVTRLLVPRLGRLRVGELTVADVEKFLTEIPGGGQTRRHVRATLRRALTDAQRAGMVAMNVAALAKPPALRKAERPWLDADQAKALLAELATEPEPLPSGATRADTIAHRTQREGVRLHALFVLALHTGLREAELLGLRWNDLEGDTLHVRRTLQRVWTGERTASGRKVKEWKLLPPKTDRSRRAVHLTPTALASLKAHRDRQSLDRGAYSTDGLVFTSETGLPLHGTNLSPILDAALRRAGLPDVTIHDLRHSSATILYAAGVPLETIADILGHSTPRITAELYRHRVPQLQRDAVERMAAALG